MFILNIAHYFPFPRVRIVKQSVSMHADRAWIEAVPDQRFHLICQICGSKALPVHSQEKRSFRDLNFASARVWIQCLYRKIVCSPYQRTPIEGLDLFDPYLRGPKRLARYIYELCKIMTIQEVARHLQVDWKTAKAVEQDFLEEQYGQTDYQGLRIPAIAEVSIRKGHRYLTVMLDYLTGRVVWVGKDRTLKNFFAGMGKRQKQGLGAIVMDMWDP